MLKFLLRPPGKLAMVGALGLLVISLVQASPLGSIEGVLIAEDGRPGGQYQVLLISDSGEELAVSAPDPNGAFRFDPIRAGNYGLGVRSPEGQSVPVMAAPIQVDGHKVVRNIRLRSSSGPVNLAPASGGIGVWWAGLSPAAKVWTVTGGLMVVGLAFAAADEDEGPGPGEEPATPSLPF